MSSDSITCEVVLAGAVLLAVGCGGSSSGGTVPCGPGTTLSDGQCVVADSGAMIPDTGGLDAHDASGRDETPMTDGSDTAVVDSTTYADDPCPTGTQVDVDCTGSCALKTNCVAAYCQDGPTPISIKSAPDIYPFIVRLPSHPGANPACAHECAAIGVPTTTVFQVSIGVEFSSEGLKVSVAPPWRILRAATAGDYCKTDSGSMNCAVVMNTGGVDVYTDDPNAPSRNVYVSAVKMTATCP